MVADSLGVRVSSSGEAPQSERARGLDTVQPVSVLCIYEKKDDGEKGGDGNKMKEGENL